MTPAEALAAIDLLEKFGMDLGLDRIQACMDALGSPQRSFATVHVGGTNGKGSTAALIASALSSSGYSTGLYTSPPLECFGERIRLNGRLLPDEEVPALYQEVLEAGERDPRAAGLTQFELITAMAFLHFARARAEVAVIEVGLGGRLDSTNVITPQVAIVTNVGLEHAEHLGRTLRAIAGEKAGIVKPGAPLVTGATGEARSVLTATAREHDVPCYTLGEHFSASPQGGGRVAYRGLRWRWDDVALGLKGPHQVDNLATALAALEVLVERGWRAPEAAVREAVAATVWPGRLEVCGHDPVVLLDGAHNPQASRALAASLKTDFRYRKLWLIIGILGDKDARSILDDLVPLCDRLVLTASTSRRALPPRALAELTGHLPTDGYRVIDTVEQALSHALRDADPEDLICVTGSLTTVGEARRHLRTLGRVS